MSLASQTVISPVAGIRTATLNDYQKLYANPHFDYLSEMLPKDIRDLFRWCEVVYNSVPSIANAIRKLINYPVTDFQIDDKSEELRTQTKSLLDALHLKNELLEFGNDIYVYGNVFRTVYIPFRRYLKCRSCGQEIAIDSIKFKVQKKDIVIECPCGHKGPAAIVDKPTNDVTKVKLVHWDPKSIELKQNPITGGTTYYYEMPKGLVQSIREGDILTLADTPKIFVDAALQGRNVKMGSNFFHGKVSSLSGYASGWGISPIMSSLKNYMYIAVLRRAMEAISMEHIVPKTILFPQQAGPGDPTVMSSMKTWKSEITKAIERWRWDPNYVMTAPYPTGMTNIGSQGRGLTPTEEIKDARMEMSLALDIPPALIMGDANIQNSAVGLRILENQLQPQVDLLEDFCGWVIDVINSAFNRSYLKPKLVPFRLADDIMQKQILLQLQGSAVSRSTIQEAFNINPDKEMVRLQREAIEDAKRQQETEKAITELQNNLMAQAQSAEQEAVTGKPSQYNQQQMIAQAQQMAMEFMQAPYEQRRSMLAQLQNEDYVMWALVSKQMESMNSQQDAQQQM